MTALQAVCGRFEQFRALSSTFLLVRSGGPGEATARNCSILLQTACSAFIRLLSYVRHRPNVAMVW
eukprot:1474286-Alexandrium_andersonii.AAC.1